jgi:hypothetical protein
MVYINETNYTTWLSLNHVYEKHQLKALYHHKLIEIYFKIIQICYGIYK